MLQLATLFWLTWLRYLLSRLPTVLKCTKHSHICIYFFLLSVTTQQLSSSHSRFERKMRLLVVFCYMFRLISHHQAIPTDNILSNYRITLTANIMIICNTSSCRLPTAAALVQTRVWSCGILWWTKVALGQVFSEIFDFPWQSTFHLLLHNHLHYHPRLAQ
jgi:hypothetical protein